MAKVWKELSAGVVEGDEMGRLALSTDADLRNELAERFGREILDDDGQIIRSKLAEAAFKTPDAAEDLTSLTFPTLYGLAREKFQELAESRQVIVFDAALIFEWCIEEDFDVVVIVTAPREDLIDRSSKRLGISKDQAEKRLEGQISIKEKVDRADYVINNDGSIEELRKKAQEIWAILTRSPASSKPGERE